MLETIKTTFSEVFGVSHDAVNTETTIDNLQEWDSLRHLELVMKLEANFGVKFKMTEIIELRSVDKIMEVLRSKEIKEAS